MLREIINFTKSISPESYSHRFKLVEGIHVQVSFDESGRFRNYQSEFYRKREEIGPFLQNCLNKQVHTKFISMNKVFDSRKKIHSCSPFCVAFKIKTINEIKDRLDDYFNAAERYCESEDDKKWADIFYNYCKKHLFDFANKVLEETENRQKQKDKRFRLADKYYLYIYLSNLKESDYQRVHEKYLAERAFNKEEFNTEFNGVLYGVPDYLSGYNQKKPFLLHRTATFTINNRLSDEDALILYKFSQLQGNQLLPNPLPIFIDKQELNDDVVKIFNREGEGRIGYKEIIQEVYEREHDLGNYYLFNFFGKTVRDFDFVSSFQLTIKPPVIIQDLFLIRNGVSTKIENIFDFEKIIVHKIFDNQVVQVTNDGGWRLRYFDEIDYKPQYIRAVMYQLVLKYRKAFYDYIYKSKRETITTRIFHDIMQTGILDDLRQDEFKEGKHSKNYSIKAKLNIWFSLFGFFDVHPTKNGEEKMANRIRELQNRMQGIVSDSNIHVENDQEFAFAAGQVIYYLLSRSEASNKSHALLEPFLQKTDINQFKMAISRTFNQYKHAISFFKGKFEKLISEVLGYELDDSLQELLPMILAGYFAQNIMFQKIDE